TMDGYQVDHLAEVAPQADIVITTTGNTRVVGVEVLQTLKPGAIIGNVGHFDDEIDLAGLSRLPGVEKIEIKPQVHEWRVPVPAVAGLERAGADFLVLSQRRPLNLGHATGLPSFAMSASFSNQVLAQIELWNSHDRYDHEVHRLAKELDEKVARLHLPALGAK